MKLYERWYVSLAGGHSIFVVIPLAIRIQDSRNVKQNLNSTTRPGLRLGGAYAGDTGILPQWLHDRPQLTTL